ncbi:TIGR00303 family protein, partial [Natronoarchaeum mannanilyticum]
MRLVLAAGSTRTAGIEGISAAGATRELMAHTPAIDAEIVEYGRPITADLVPVSPTGCPTPAVITRAVREAVGFEFTVIDAGLAAETGA